MGILMGRRAEEISRNDRARSQQPPGGRTRDGSDYVPPNPGIPFVNTTGSQIPAYACLGVTAWTLNTDLACMVATVEQPTQTFRAAYLLNGELPVDNNTPGRAQIGPRFRALYTGSPTYGAGFGPTPGQWYLTAGFPTLMIADGIYDSTNTVMQGSFSGTITQLLGKASGPIPARNGASYGGGTMAIYYNSGGTLTDTTMTVGVRNLGAAIPDTTYIEAIFIGDAFCAVAGDAASGPWLVKTTTSHASGATHDVNLWNNGSGGSETVSTSTVVYSAVNRTSITIPSGKFCLMHQITIGGTIVYYVEPWEC